MSGDDPVYSSLVQLAQYSLGYGTSRGRLGAGTELVDEHQCPGVGLCQHFLHGLEK